jgi:hypothetical protein
MTPEHALGNLSLTGMQNYHYHHMPLLVLFGMLSKEAVLDHNTTEMEVAAAVARRALARCVVAQVEDPDGSAVRVGAHALRGVHVL